MHIYQVTAPHLPQAADAVAKPAGGGLLSSFVRSIGVSMVGTAALTRDDIEPALEALKRKLMERNVAAEIADKCACCSILPRVSESYLSSDSNVGTHPFPTTLIPTLLSGRFVVGGPVGS